MIGETIWKEKIGRKLYSKAEAARGFPLASLSSSVVVTETSFLDGQMVTKLKDYISQTLS